MILWDYLILMFVFLFKNIYFYLMCFLKKYFVLFIYYLFLKTLFISILFYHFISPLLQK